jgi:hypothetical protein
MFVAHIVDDTAGTRPEFENLIHWSIIPGTAGRLSTTTGGKTMLNGAGYQYCEVVATFINPINPGQVMTDTAGIYVKKDVSKVNRLEMLSVSKAGEKAKIIREYYNLRGQKLPLYGISHADGIVLERVIEPMGKVRVQKKFLVPNPNK